MPTSILLSIRPEYVDSILEGSKRFEFRRRRPIRDVDTVIVYATEPVGRVVAQFSVKDIVHLPLAELWRKTRRYAGISEATFIQYFDGLDSGYAYTIDEVTVYDTAFDIAKLNVATPPQSFCYLDDL